MLKINDSPPNRKTKEKLRTTPTSTVADEKSKSLHPKASSSKVQEFFDVSVTILLIIFFLKTEDFNVSSFYYGLFYNLLWNLLFFIHQRLLFI